MMTAGSDRVEEDVMRTVGFRGTRAADALEPHRDERSWFIVSPCSRRRDWAGPVRFVHDRTSPACRMMRGAQGAQTISSHRRHDEIQLPVGVVCGRDRPRPCGARARSHRAGARPAVAVAPPALADLDGSIEALVRTVDPAVVQIFTTGLAHREGVVRPVRPGHSRARERIRCDRRRWRIHRHQRARRAWGIPNQSRGAGRADGPVPAGAPDSRSCPRGSSAPTRRPTSRC